MKMDLKGLDLSNRAQEAGEPAEEPAEEPAGEPAGEDNSIRNHFHHQVTSRSSLKHLWKGIRKSSEKAVPDDLRARSKRRH